MSYQFPSGLGIYWAMQTLLAVLQQKLFMRKKKAA